MVRWWLAWASAAYLALRYGLYQYANHLIGLAGMAVLITLDRLNIYYGARLA